jgi:hypothetical protein
MLQAGEIAARRSGISFECSYYCTLGGYTVFAGDMPVVTPDNSLSACALFQLETVHNSTQIVTTNAKATTITRQSRRSFEALFMRHSPQSAAVTPIRPKGSSGGAARAKGRTAASASRYGRDPASENNLQRRLELLELRG